jgi:hypothetical protein
MPINLGDLNFQGIDLNAADLGSALQRFISQGSNTGFISKNDLTIISRNDNRPSGFTSVADAINCGTRLFDALCYFSIPELQRPEVEIDALDAEDEDPSLESISKSVFYVYMYILIRGRAPIAEDDAENAPVPKFLTTVMGLTDKPTSYVNNISSFNLNQMDHTWIKHVTINNLSQKAQNRLALGMAGYRLPAALTIYPFKQNASNEAKTAANAIKEFVNKGATWDCHAVTRTPAFLDVVKNFNANINNLILEVYTEQQITTLLNNKVLAVKPVENPRFTNWRNWNNETFRQFTDFIFPH